MISIVHSQSKVLSVLQINIQSLPNHMDELRFDMLSSSSDVILVSESWLKPSIKNCAVALNGYNLSRNDRVLAVVSAFISRAI